MEFDYSLSTSLTAGAVLFPEYVFQDTPLQPGQIKESIFLEGNTTGGNVSLQGSVDSIEI